MNTEQICRINSTSSDNTIKIAEEIANNLRGGEVIELASDLGGGKTTFVKGLAKGLGVKEAVHSPSFTISTEHKGSKINLIHFDFYRLNEAGIIEQEISEYINQPDTVVAIEWAEIVEELLPVNKLQIKIKVVDENSRLLKIYYNENNKYLIPHQYLTS